MMPEPAGAVAASEFHPRSKPGCRWMVRLAVGFVILLRLYFHSDANILLSSSPRSGPTASHHFDEEKCAAAVNTVMDSFLRDNADLVMVQDVRLAVQLAMDPVLRGDIVEVSLSEIGSTCVQQWTPSVLIAVAQRASNASPFCPGSRGATAHTRAVWLAFQEDYCVDTVRKMFQAHSLHVTDNPHVTRGLFSLDVPVYLVLGALQQTLPDLPVEHVSFLRIADHSTLDHDNESLRRWERDALIALFSMYRRVQIGGFVSLDGIWDSDEVKEFLTDAELNKQNVTSALSSSSIFFKKGNTQIRIPPKFRKDVITKSVDPRVLEAWTILDGWHRETVRKFFGHVGTNPFQTYR
ncbi:hypothetical protein ACHAWX_005024 [Stephanocyclus meneghinianus]